MPTYKGNRGHLMQHWPLCEMLRVAAHKGVTGLNYIDAYAMSPLATERQVGDVHFDNIKNCLPSCGESAYELAWHQLAPYEGYPSSAAFVDPLMADLDAVLGQREGYPNSAAFVEQVWEGDFSMLLCEIDQATCQEIEPWLQRVGKLGRCKETELFCGNWRERFKKGLPSPAEVGLEDGSLTLVLFDPYICSQRQGRRVVMPNFGYLYIDDIEMAAGAMGGLDDGILVQLSTYSAMANPQGAVISSMNQILVANDFRLIAVVRVDGSMMSLVYERNVSWAAELADLPGRFDNWFPKI